MVDGHHELGGQDDLEASAHRKTIHRADDRLVPVR